MTDSNDLDSLISKANNDSIDAVKGHWQKACSIEDSISKFDNFSKGWDRLSSEFFPEIEATGYRFKKLTGLCTAVAESKSIDDFLKVDGPIKNEMERLEKDAQKDFNKAQKCLSRHRSYQLSDRDLMESIGALLWTVRSNSMHGRKTTSGPIGPTNRDEQICRLGSFVLVDMYRTVFPHWPVTPWV